MRQDLKDKWIEGLRSGKYRQGQKFFKYHDAEGNICHCAVGVLGQIMVDTGELQEYTSLPGEEYGDNPNLSKAYRFGDNLGHLSPFSRLYFQHGNAIYTMNDDEGKTFPEIADWIEKNVEVTPF